MLTVAHPHYTRIGRREAHPSRRRHARERRREAFNWCTLSSTLFVLSTLIWYLLPTVTPTATALLPSSSAQLSCTGCHSAAAPSSCHALTLHHRPPSTTTTIKSFSTLALQLYTPTDLPSPALLLSHSVPPSSCCPGLADHPTLQIPDSRPKSRIHLRPDHPLLYRYPSLHALDDRCPMRSAR